MSELQEGTMASERRGMIVLGVVHWSVRNILNV